MSIVHILAFGPDNIHRSTSRLHNQLPHFPAHALSTHGLPRQAKWAFYPARSKPLAMYRRLI